MARYEAYLLLHVAAAIIWLGGGLMMTVQAIRAARARDEKGIEKVFSDIVSFGNTLFVPASLVVLAMGILMVVDGPWEFDQLWIVLALAGYLATFLNGVLVLKPAADRIHAMMARDGGMSPECVARTHKLLIEGRADLVVLYLILTVMVTKPTGGDVVLLGAVAAVLIAAVVYVLVAARRVVVPASAGDPASGASPGPGRGGIVGST